jgi:hypothetical protein
MKELFVILPPGRLRLATTPMAFYDKMSVLQNEILSDLKAQRIDYEEFLKRIADLAKQVETGKANDTAGEAGYAREACSIQQSQSEPGFGAPD